MRGWIGKVVGQMEEKMPASSLWKMRPHFLTSPYGLLAFHNLLLCFAFAAHPSTFPFLPPPQGVKGGERRGAWDILSCSSRWVVFLGGNKAVLVMKHSRLVPSTGSTFAPQKFLFLTCYRTSVSSFFFSKSSSRAAGERQHMTTFHLDWARIEHVALKNQCSHSCGPRSDELWFVLSARNVSPSIDRSPVRFLEWFYKLPMKTVALMNMHSHIFCSNVTWLFLFRHSYWLYCLNGFSRISVPGFNKYVWE